MASMVLNRQGPSWRWHAADFLLQSGLTKQIHFHGKRFPWFVSDVTKKDWDWLLNTMVYGQLFSVASDMELESLRRLGRRWKVCFYVISPRASSCHVSSNTRRKGDGFMNSTHSGVLVIRSGSSIPKPQISFCISQNLTLSSLKVIWIIENLPMIVPLPQAHHLKWLLGQWPALQAHRKLQAFELSRVMSLSDLDCRVTRLQKNWTRLNPGGRSAGNMWVTLCSILKFI